jgi:hypothetical protein
VSSAMIFEPAGMCGTGIELGDFDSMMLTADHRLSLAK